MSKLTELERQLKQAQDRERKATRAFYRLEGAFRGSYDESRAAHAKGRYPFIPNDPSWVIQQLEVASKELHIGYYNRKFVDVGCGIGSKLALAQAFGFVTYGVEIDPELAKIARRICYGGSMNIIEGDALEQDYGEYDVVYFYRPFAEEKLEKRLEQRIVTTAKPGAIILANLKCDGMKPWRPQDKLVESIDGSNTIYRRLA